MAPISLSIPHLAGHEADYVLDCLRTGWISSVGAYVNRFEEDFATWLGSGTGAVAVINGTAALHLALLVAGIQPEEEVLVPALTFIAPIHAVRYVGAIPVFLDCDRDSLGLSPTAVASFIDSSCEERDDGLINRTTGRKVTAMLPVHVLGHACRMHELAALADRYRLTLLEDAAEGVGCYHHERHVGTFGKLGCFSFNGNKTLSTGGGGMVVSSDPLLLQQVRHLATQAKADELHYLHDAIGYNYRLSNLHAAIGTAQLEHLPAMLARKRHIHDRLAEVIHGLDGIELFREAPCCRSNYWLAMIFLPLGQRDHAQRHFRQVEIETRPLWELNHRQPRLCHFPCAPIPIATDLHARALCLPCHPALSDAEVDRICKALTTLAASQLQSARP